LFLPVVYLQGKTRSLIQGAVIVLAAVVAFGLLGYTREAWPLYWFLLLGVVHLYAIVFTRGAALGSAMWFLTAATVVSIAWSAVHSHLPTTGAFGTLSTTILRIVPVVGWLLTTGYMLYLGRQTMPAIETASSYFLAAAALTLGFWGVWLFYLENGLVTSTIYHVAIGVGLLLPVLCTALLFTLPGQSQRERRRWLMGLAALALVALSANLVLIEPLFDALAFLLGRFLPRLVGVAPLNDITATSVLSGHGWRKAATSLMLLVAAAFVVVQAALEISKEEAGPSVEMIDDSNPTQIIAGPVLAAAGASTDLARRSTAGVVTAQGGATGDAVDEASFQARFIGEIAYRIVTNVLDTLRRAFYAVLPSVAFSLLSILIMLVLGKLGEYLRHGPFEDALSLWGMMLSIPIGAVVLCGIAYDFAPAQRSSPWQRRRIFGIPLMVIAAGSLLASLGYFLTSAVTWGLLPMLWPGTTHIGSVLTNDPYIVNLAISTAVLALLAVLYVISEAAGRAPRQSRLPSRLFSIPAAAVFVLVAITSIYVGEAPIQATVAFATGPYSSSAAPALRDRLPPALVSGCEPDYLLVPGQTASVTCRDADGTNVSYHAFEDPDRLRQWFAAALHARGVTIGNGSCARLWPAEGSFSGEGRTGEMACYVDRRGAWLLWTDNRDLGIALRSDGRTEALYSSWSAGTYWLSAP
jgi:hypothetical protein